jgi:hypothetical protein
VEFWNNGYIEEASTGIILQYGAVTGGSPELASVIDTYIVLSDEDFDPQMRQVVEWEPGSINEQMLSETPEEFDENGDSLLPDFLI